MPEKWGRDAASTQRASRDYSFLQPVLIKKMIRECLNRATPTGDFSMCAQLPHFSNPGLYVDEIGAIGLPLSDRDAKALRAACQPVPGDEVSNTILDSDVGKTWELDADQFELRNPAWQCQLKEILKDVAEKLGVGTIDGAQLCKLLLSEEGATFRPLQDSEKTPGIFGTLVICLPSLHSGGQINIKHGDKTSVLDTSQHSAYEMTYMAWYSDVLHQIEPVISGYRLVLTYNLIKTESNGKVPRALDLNDKIGRAHDFFRAWQNKDGARHWLNPPMLAYKLEHKYANRDLAFETLKDDDRKLVSKFESICDDLGDWCIYLANFERSVVDFDDDDEDDIYHAYDYGFDLRHTRRDTKEFASWIRDPSSVSYEDSIEDTLALTTVVDRERTTLGTGMSISRDCFVQNDIFDEVPDVEDEEDTGYELTTVTYRYRSTCALLMPKSSTIPFFLDRHFMYDASPDGSSEIEKLGRKWLDQSLSAYKACPSDLIDLEKSVRGRLTAICTAVVKTNKGRYNIDDVCNLSACYSHDVVATALEAALILKDSALFLDLLDCGLQYLPKEGLGHVAKAFHEFGTEIIGNRIVQLFKGIGGFSPRVKLVHDLAEISQDQCRECNQWTTIVLQELLSSCSMIFESDGVALIDTIAFSVGHEDWTAILEKIIEAVKRPTTTTLASSTFLERIYNMHQDRISRALADEMFKSTVSALIRDLDIDKSVAKSEKRPFWHQTSPNNNVATVLTAMFEQRRAFESGQVRPAPPPTSGYRLYYIIEKCFDLGLKDIVKLESAIMKAAYTVSGDGFHGVLLPLLSEFLSRQTSQSSSRKGFQQRLFRHVLQLLINRYVREEPQLATVNWSRRIRGCGCADCIQFVAFYASPTERTWRLTAPQKRRTHIENWIYPTTCECWTEKSGSPHTLVVDKGELQADKDHREWKDRCEMARQRLKLLDGPRLMEILGDHYQSIKDLKFIPDAARRPILAAVSPNVRAATASAAPIKTEIKNEPETGLASIKIESRDHAVFED